MENKLYLYIIYSLIARRKGSIFLPLGTSPWTGLTNFERQAPYLELIVKWTDLFLADDGFPVLR